MLDAYLYGAEGHHEHAGTPDESSAVAVALAVVSEALRLAPLPPQGRGPGSL
jgi:hypothetical protein